MRSGAVARCLPRRVLPLGEHTVEVSLGLELEHEDGSSAGDVETLVKQYASQLQAGRFECLATFDPPLWFPTLEGARVPVRALRWVETNRAAVSKVRREASGEPKLVLQQLGSDGNPTSGRVVVDVDLFAWHVQDDGTVVARGPLA